MQQDRLEKVVLSSVKTIEEFNYLREEGVTDETFVVFPGVFEFIEDYIREYQGKIPASEVLQDEFPEFLQEEATERANEDFRWYVKKLLEAELSRRISGILERGIHTLVEEDKPLDALDIITSELNGIRPERQMNKSLTDSDAMRRLEVYREKVEKLAQGELPGLPTGIKFLDEQGVSLLPGQLIGLLGATKKGKSWLALYLACIAYALGKRVAFFSPELSIHEVETRWDSIMGKIMGAEFSNMSLLHGHYIDVDTYKDYLETVSERSDWLTITSDSFKKPLTLETIEAQVARFKPDVFVVDGIYLLKSSKKDTWERIMEITYGLKALATSRNIVGIVSNQLQRGAADKENPELSEVGYSFAFAQAVDKCIMVSKAEGRVSDNFRIIRLTGVRSGTDIPPQEVIWDVDSGIIGQSLDGD